MVIKTPPNFHFNIKTLFFFFFLPQSTPDGNGSSCKITDAAGQSTAFLSDNPNLPALPLSDFSMDWQGQKVVEQLMQIMLVVFAAVAIVTGYVMGSFQNMLIVYGAGVVLTSLITLPNWPFFNRHPLKWLDPSEAEKHPKPQTANASVKKKTGKK